MIEGILVLHMAELRESLNMKIYVDTGAGGGGAGGWEDVG
jgi:uridine kinase